MAFCLPTLVVGGMVHRILVCADNNDEKGHGSTVSAISLFTAVSVVAAVAAAPGIWPQQVGLAFGGLVLYFVWWRLSQQSCVGYNLLLYPAGLQMEKVRLGTERQVLSSSTLRFVPISSIHSCVVVEIVLAHRVRDSLVLRLHRTSADQSHGLVDLFPAVSLTHEECMRLRSIVNNHLKNELNNN